MLRKIMSNRKVYVIIILVFLTILRQPISCISSSNLGIPFNKFVDKCEQRCIDQNRTHSADDSNDTLCKNECKLEQCKAGCRLWESALKSSCQTVCNKTEINDFDNLQLFCVKGCNDASNFYFQWVKQEIPEIEAPALVPDSLTATTLSLEWFVPRDFTNLAQGTLFKETTFRKYFVQCYEDSEEYWKLCKNQTFYENSTIHIEKLQPYTRYKFRVGLLLSENEAIYSQPSVIISTNEEGTPESKPQIISIRPVDHTRVMVSWKCGLKNNGKIISYSLLITDLSYSGYNAIKEVPAQNETNHYMFEKLGPAKNYSIQIGTRNARGLGPYVLAKVSTPPLLTNLSGSQEEPKLILASEYTILTQGPNFLMEEPTVFYTTTTKINGIALHVAKKLMFVCEDSGYIYQVPLDSKAERREVISSKNELKFKPSLMSVDWLNNHLYIMGEIIVNSAPQSWLISRFDFDFDGRKSTVAIAGIKEKIDHIEVDPYNGYLFWVITGESLDSGLFRLDLGDISNGIKHESQPYQMIRGQSLGAFTVDHTRFRLLVPFQNENTIKAVSLDGKEWEDIRRNTQSPLLHSVKALAMANGLFYWTNGREVMTEEYHQKHNSYFHNAYPDVSNTSLISVCANSSSSQPIPVPVNPPSNVQALLGSSSAKVSWQTPQLIGNQGKGAFKNWLYKLEVFNHETKNKSIFDEITGNSYTVENLLPNMLHTFRVEAYTKAGIGPWSQEFKASTLKTSDKRYLIWASIFGLLQSDVIGENIVTLLPREELGDANVTDIAWFEDILYIVANNTLKIYNRTNGELQKLGQLDSVGGVAVDWISRRLYWSNPTQQLITRGHLNGEHQEPLSIIASARELKIDSPNGNIYYTTGLTIDGCRLNGKNCKNYFTVPPYSGKQVMGLTLDLINQFLYWIVRSYQGSSLFSAKLIGEWPEENDSGIVETKLEEKNLNGPLTYFSDRLVWRQENKSLSSTIVISDVNGENLAYFDNNKLIGLTCIVVIDKTQHLYPSNYETINVIPEPVNPASIQVIGTYKYFNITWDAVMNVNMGKVYYEIKIISSKAPDLNINAEQLENVFQFPTKSVEPYTSLEIFIRAFTFWGSSAITKSANLHSPPAPPSQPMLPRVYTRHLDFPLIDTMKINATFRWSLPTQPNGKLLGYKVRCYEEGHDGNAILVHNATVTGHEKTFHNLKKESNYMFQVLAYTSVGDGIPSLPVHVNTLHERPIPKVLVSTHQEILEVDLDILQTSLMQVIKNPIVALTHIAHERKLYWFDDNKELLSYQMGNHSKTKLMTATSDVKAMTVDWIERIIYWAQIDSNNTGGVIYSFNLNQQLNRNGKVSVKKIAERQNVISDLVVSPFDRKLFWIENHKNLSEESFIYSLNLDIGSVSTKMLFDDFGDTECMNKTAVSINPIPGTLLFATSPINPPSENFIGDLNAKHQSTLIFEMNNQFNQQFVATDFKTKECFDFGSIYPAEGSNLAKDSNKIYWIHEGMIYSREDSTSKSISLPIPQKANKLLAFYQQRFPEKRCMIPLPARYHIQLVNVSDNFLEISLPMPRLPKDCPIRSVPIKYTIHYIDVKFKGTKIEYMKCMDHEDCRVLETNDRRATIGGLKPFTEYFVQIALSSIYDNKINLTFSSGKTFSTEPGPPSKPRNVSAIPLSFNEILVNWLVPEIFNGANLTYDIHWQTENMRDNTKNKKQKHVNKTSSNEIINFDEIITEIIDVEPDQMYTIWVEASSAINKTSISNSVNVQSYSEPLLIKLNSTSPNSMIIKWKAPKNISSYQIQYSQIDSSEIFNVTDELPEHDEIGYNYFNVTNLEPKTKYNFSINIKFINIDTRSYRWPVDKIALFETVADRPSKPGKPQIEYVADSVYKIAWNASKDNGDQIKKYVLESKRIYSNSILGIREKRSIDSNIEGDVDEVTDMPNEIDEKSDEKWTEKFSGLSLHSIIRGLTPINEFIFRVKACNELGCSEYSDESEIFNSSLLQDQTGGLLKEAGGIWKLIIFLPISLVAIVVVFVCLILLFYRNNRNKKMNDDGMRPIPDFELATIRDLQAGENSILNNRNILYNHFYGSAIINTEIKHLPHIHLNQIILTDICLGKGAFGEVYSGIVKNEDGSEECVAIKTLRKTSTEVEKREFLQEAQLMSNFKHEHILRLIGICLNKNGSLLYIIMELMENGDLLSYLRDNRPSINRPSSLKLIDLISMCVDVASGCGYLEEMHFVHRDIAARNCLVKHIIQSDAGSQRVVKIGDFGLARDIYKNDYYRKEGECLLPVRWMSPESLVDGIFTSQSDIWAFGVLMWEVMTLGQQPYPARANVEVLRYVREGGRLPRPSQNCPEELYQLMTKCWNKIAECPRPTFRYCLEVLKQVRDKTSHYTQIELQYPNDGPYRYVSSNDSSILNEKLCLDPPPSMEVNSKEQSQENPSLPKYLELMYDENDGKSVENLCEAPANYCEKHQADNKENLNRSNDNNNTINGGYIVPVSLDCNLDINANNCISTKSRTLSNSSTVSNNSDKNCPQTPELHTTLVETCKSFPLIEQDHKKYYPRTSIMTHQSGWV